MERLLGGKIALPAGDTRPVKVGASTVLCRGLQPICARAEPVSFRMFLNLSLSSDQTMTLQWQRTGTSPKECASFRYSSVHCRLISLARL